MKGFITNNFKLKVVALGIAVVFWILVGGQRQAEVVFLVPIDLKGIPEDLVMTTVPPGVVEVRLAGPESYINDLSIGQVNVEVDLSRTTEGLNKLRIRSGDVSAPGAVRVVHLSPRSFETRMERLVTTILPLRVNFTGTPAKGFKAITVTPEPEHVTVIGRKKYVDKVKRVYTKLLDIEGLSRTGTFPMLVDLPDKVDRVEPEKVEVTVTIGAK